MWISLLVSFLHDVVHDVFAQAVLTDRMEDVYRPWTIIVSSNISWLWFWVRSSPEERDSVSGKTYYMCSSHLFWENFHSERNGIREAPTWPDHYQCGSGCVFLRQRATAPSSSCLWFICTQPIRREGLCEALARAPGTNQLLEMSKLLSKVCEKTVLGAVRGRMYLF